MKIFIAGATGTLGIPLTEELVARGHSVVGLSRSEAKRPVIEKLGAAAAIADALDEPALARAVRDARPDVVVHLLTAIPKNGPMRPADMNATNDLRILGTAHLLRAAMAAGAKRMVAESVIFAYGYGDHGDGRLREEDPIQPVGSGDMTRETVVAIRSLEDQVLTAAGKRKIEGIILRFGLLYGPGVPAMESNLELLRRRRIPVVRGRGSLSWIHINDAVTATIAAIERGGSGEVYNISDDEPASYRDVLLAAAETIGAPRPRTLPFWLLRMTAPYAAAFLGTRLNVANGKAKHELGWRPRFKNFREGLRDLTVHEGQEKKAA